MKKYERELNFYNKLNSVAEKGGVVLFGTSFANAIPVGELRQSIRTDYKVYNRSFNDITISDAIDVVDDAVLTLCPDKIILMLGESDLERGYRTIDTLMEDYSNLINRIKSYDNRCDLILVSVCGGDAEYPDEFNRRLMNLAKKNRCMYADITAVTECDIPHIKAFSLLRYFMLSRITAGDVMSYI